MLIRFRPAMLFRTRASVDHLDERERMTGFSGRGTIFIFGLPRSGTSWLAKIFDSHPDVLYRHEPDIVTREKSLPQFCPLSKMEAHLQPAREYLTRLVNVQTVKAAGPMPLFAKRYLPALAQVLRKGLIIGLRGAEMVTGDDRWPSRVPIPDLIPEEHWRDMRIVIKSINAIGRARLFMEAWPDSRAIIIVRHPCGQVASFLRGIELGKFDPPGPIDEISRAREAEQLGLRIEEPATLSVAELLAWEWAFFNQQMLNDLSGVSRVKIVPYRDLAANPIGVARELFDFTGLPWDLQTAKFIQESTTSRSGQSYYSLKRNPVEADNKWHDALSAEDQQRILAITDRVPIGRELVLADHGELVGGTPAAVLSEQ